MVYLNQYKKLKTIEPIRPEDFFSPDIKKEDDIPNQNKKVLEDKN